MSEDALHVEDWFPENLSDEAAFALHGFLQEFTWRFEQAYYAQIRRYIEDAQDHHAPLEEDDEVYTPQGDVEF